MDLSVIIVNYNVKHFLEQCLYSVLKASENISAEIFVVDNNSVDGSKQLIPEKFPEIYFISNKKNEGFSKANNQAIKRAKGKYILLLNPDTVVEENTFTKVIDFMNKHPDAGCLGVKMIDGKGNFLPESKRGLPTPWVAFYKMFGLSFLFPKSKKFGKYHLTYLDENEINIIDVVAGAFMFLRSSILDKTGLLDETFFMYGEDIDLSYRVQKAGFKNYYFPETTIIHYKGESTKKSSLNYVKVFYKAMVIFAKKHFPGGKAGLLSFFIHIAIYFRAFISATQRIFDKTYIPVIDVFFIYLGYRLITPLWENIRFEPGHFPPQFLSIVVPIYIFIWLLGILFSGGYKKPANLYKLIRGLIWGSIAILVIYSLVDIQFRFSRALILLGSVWSIAILTLYRLIFDKLRIKDFVLDKKSSKKIAIVGHLQEATRVKNLLTNANFVKEVTGFVALNKDDNGEDYIGHIDQLQEIISINRISEVIYCAENVSSAEIIKSMLELTQMEVDFKIAPPESISIIGSNSIHTSGDLYVMNINSISKPSNRRKKRIFDLSFALLNLLLSPLTIWFFRKKGNYFLNIFLILTGNKTCVGYIPGNENNKELPRLKEGVLTPGNLNKEQNLGTDEKMRMNILYAKDYSVKTDTEIIAKGWKFLDN